MYESIEKGYCQDEGKYEVKSPSTDQPTQSGMKTSTPERKSMAGEECSVIVFDKWTFTSLSFRVKVCVKML